MLYVFRGFINLLPVLAYSFSLQKHMKYHNLQLRQRGPRMKILTASQDATCAARKKCLVWCNALGVSSGNIAFTVLTPVVKLAMAVGHAMLIDQHSLIKDTSIGLNNTIFNYIIYF